MGQRSEGQQIADVLIVDDTSSNVTFLSEALENEDCRCRVATSAKRAIAAIAAKAPDVILLDIMMPEMNGYELCQLLKAEHQTAAIPVLFLSALSEPFDKVLAFECGGADYITKPFHISEVRARVQLQIRLRRLQHALEALSATDVLTGLANRRRFDEVLAAEWSRAQRRGDPLSVLVIDVDFFKRYNDAYGHLAGDQCLRQVGDALRGALSRVTDLVARYGGEEFVVVLPGIGADECARQAERLRAAIKALAIPHGDSTAAPIVTISVGGATASPQPGDAVNALVQAADTAVYRAKAAGRDRVELAPAREHAGHDE